jgi:hypothetical protein
VFAFLYKGGRLWLTGCDMEYESRVTTPVSDKGDKVQKVYGFTPSEGGPGSRGTRDILTLWCCNSYTLIVDYKFLFFLRVFLKTLGAGWSKQVIVLRHIRNIPLARIL